MYYELSPIGCSQKSFYGKAHVIREGNVLKLKSYETIVCKYDADTDRFTRLWGGYSATTMRHVNAFLLECGWPCRNKAWWDALPVGE